MGINEESFVVWKKFFFITFCSINSTKNKFLVNEMIVKLEVLFLARIYKMLSRRNIYEFTVDR